MNKYNKHVPYRTLAYIIININDVNDDDDDCCDDHHRHHN